MVARTPPTQKKFLAPLNPVLLRETVKKVDQCMARLQELQYTVAGGTKVISGKSLSPRSTRGYLKTSFRCKQENLRIKNAASRKSPVGKFAGSTGGDWRRMSLPAMLVGETVGEILQASEFAREIVAVTKKTSIDDPKTPVTEGRKQRPQPENTELRARRNREKQVRLQSIRTESDAPSLQRARSRIHFKVVSPKKKGEFNKENYNLSANRVSPRHRPWATKTVMFPNPLFLQNTPSKQQKFYRTRSPVLAKAPPHKFLIKSPPSATKSHLKIKNLPASISPTRPKAALGNKSSPPRVSAAVKFRRSFSPSRLANRLVSPLKNNRLVSPLKNRKFIPKSDGLTMKSGLKQRPATSSMVMPTRLSVDRI